MNYKFANRLNWTPKRYSVICVNHFEDKFISYSKGKRENLKWSLNLVPTIHSKPALEKPSILPTTSTSRKSPKERIFQEDEGSKFIKASPF